MAKKLYIKTYGCQMNVYDSSRMEDMMAPLGYESVDSPDDADLIVLNTCHIREKAAEKVYSDLGRVRSVKDRKQAEGKQALIAVAGCVGQAEGQEIFRRAPFVDIVMGPQSYQNLPDFVGQALRQQMKDGKARAMELDFDAVDKFDRLPSESRQRNTQGFLTIQEGCDKFCTFCVVPYTRGAEYSRPVAEVLREARQLVASGAREITLLGQNVNAYHGQDGDGKEQDLAYLIAHLAELDGLERIRYTTSHPRDMGASLIRAHGEIGKLMPYLHLPVQSGSDAILKRMNRKHTRERYFEIMDQLRAVRSDIAFSSDFIVGFPGESEEDFEATLDLIRRVKFAQAYSFKYSMRPGTPAAAVEDQIPETVKDERLQVLQALLQEQQQAFNADAHGRLMPILIEREGRRPGQWIGRSPYMQSVVIESPLARIGDMISVMITDVQPRSLRGEPVAEVHPRMSEPIRLVS